MEENEATEQEQPTEQQSEEKPFAEMLQEIKAEHKQQIAEMEVKHKAELKERDSIIKQLIKGENVSHETFIDRLNAKRNFKKW